MQKEDIGIKFFVLQEKLLRRYKNLGYSNYSVDCVRRRTNKVLCFMEENSIVQYEPSVGEQFLHFIECNDSVSINVYRRFKTLIRHLDECCLDIPFAKYPVTGYPSINEEYDELLKEYIKYCSQMGNAESTIKHKAKSFVNLFSFLASSGYQSLNSINEDAILQAVINETNHVRWSDYRDSIRFLVASNLLNHDYSYLVPVFRQNNRIPDTYTKDELKAVEESIDTTTAVGKRDYAIILLADHLGIRSKDIESLSLENIDFNNETILFRQSKTKAPIELPLLPEIKSALTDWINNGRPDINSNLLFTSIRAPYTGIKSSAMYAIANKRLKSSKVKVGHRRSGLHSFRASLSTAMVNNGLTYEETRKAIGHSGDNSIKHYVSLDVEKLRICAQEVPAPSGNFMKIGGQAK